MDYPRYTTFSPAERAKLGLPPPGASGDTGRTAPVPRERFVRSHTCAVSYPDGTEGTCLYERMGPAYHRFDHRYGDKSHMPRQHLTRPLPGGVPAIEEKARELAAAAFGEAMEWERKDYFARASEPTSGARKADPSKWKLTAGQARKLGGKYALCVRVGKGLVPATSPVDTFQEVAAQWRERKDLLVGCCNRLDRCWELLKLNTLLVEGHPKKDSGGA